MLSSIPAQVQSQSEQTTISDITGFSVPRIDGLIDKSSPQLYVNEWQDSLQQKIQFKSKDNTYDTILNSKVVSDNLYLSMLLPAVQFVRLQVDVDGNGVLSKGDAQVAILIDNQDTSSAVGIYNGTTWMGLPDWNPEYANQIKSPILGEKYSMISSSAVRMQADQSFSLEVSFSLDSYRTIFGLDPSKVDTTNADIGYGLIFSDMKENKFGYPSIPKSDGYVSSVNDYSIHEYNPSLFKVYGIDIGVSHIEVTQTVQTRTNQLSLVQNKDTLARVTIDNPTTATLPVEVRLSGKTLDFSTSSVRDLGTITQTFTAPVSPQRTDINDTANFELPDAWTSTDLLILKAEVSPILKIDTDYSNNKMMSASIFKKTHDLNIYYMEVNEGTADSPSLISDTNPDFIPTAFDHFRALYPMANPHFIKLGWETLGVFSGGSVQLKTKLNNIASNIIASRAIAAVLGVPESALPPVPDIVFGFRTKGAGSSAPKWGGWDSSFAGWGGLGAAVGPMVLSHEINHDLGTNTWGRHTGDGSTYDANYGCHAAGPNAAWPDPGDDNIDAVYEDNTLGWDARYGLISWDRNDLMSYCQAPTNPYRWMSDYRWEKLVNRLETYSPGHPAPSSVSSIHPSINNMFNSIMNYPDQYLSVDQSKLSMRMVSGVLIKDGTGYLNPSYSMPGVWSNSAPTMKAGQTPNYYVKVTYSSTTKEYPIYRNYTDVTNHDTGNLNSVGFQFALEDNGTIQNIRLLDAKKNELDLLSPSGYTNQYDLRVPAQLKRGSSAGLSLMGTASNKSVLYTQVQYSNDGNIWYDYGPQTLGTIPKLPVNSLPGGKAVQFRLRVTDGFNTQYVDGNQTAQISDLKPSVRISKNTFVSETQEYHSPLATGSLLSLTAHGYDPEDGIILSNKQVQWNIVDVMSDSVSQQYGVNLTMLPTHAGTYKIGVTVTDSAGNSASDSLVVNVDQPAYLTEELYKDFLSQKTSDTTTSKSTTSTSTSTSNTEDTTSPLPTTAPQLPFSSLTWIGMIVLLEVVLIRRKRILEKFKK